MSTESYSKWWIKTKDNLEKVKDFDQGMIKMKAVKDRSLANTLLGGLYSRYSIVIQDMDACLDQMIQVQKSFTVRKLMDAAVSRLNELKDELTKLDISEYHYIDGALIELKLIPHEVEIIHPTFVFPRQDEYEQFWRKLKNGEVIYDAALDIQIPEETEEKKKTKKSKKVKIDPLAMLNVAPPPTETIQTNAETSNVEEQTPTESGEHRESDGGATESERKSEEDRLSERKVSTRKSKRTRPRFIYQPENLLTEEEREELKRKERLLAAIKLIQSHERARQARLYFVDVFGTKIDKGQPNTTASKVSVAVSNKIDNLDRQDAAATLIQSRWRGYLTRQNLQRREIQRRMLIGMIEPSWKSHEEFVKLKKSLERGREIRDQAIRDYLQAIIDENARVLRVVAPGLFEDIGDEIRQWFKDWYYTCKVFKEIPPVEEGGTVLVIRGDIETPEEHYAQMLRSKKKDKNAAAKEKAKKAAAEKKKKEMEKAKKERAKAEKATRRNQEYEFKPSETPAVLAMNDGLTEYAKMWEHVNDADNPHNKPYMDMVTEQKCYEIQLQVRTKVDEVMRIELQLLQMAIEKDKWLAKKKKGKFKPKKKKGKKGKPGKKGKRGKKDPTGNRRIEDMFQELYQNGIIRTYPEVHIDEFFGDFSYQNWEKREGLRDPPATLADVRQAVIMNCILPLGVERMVRPKSVLIVGPRECGLEILANAVFNETRCVLFDLSAQNVAGKYPGKKGNKDLINLVTKMSRILAPSIIYVENAEKTFYKKVPKDERELEPKRVGKFLMKKIVKPITANDRVLVLGTSYMPWLGQAAKIRKAFQRILLVPRSDYGSIYLCWRQLLMPYHGIDRNIDLSCLTLMTQYYPMPQIQRAVQHVMTSRRLIQLTYKPLRQEEMLAALREGTGPVDDKEWSKFVKFYGGTKLAKDRKKLMVGFQKILDDEEKKSEKGKMKKQ